MKKILLFFKKHWFYTLLLVLLAVGSASYYIFVAPNAAVAPTQATLQEQTDDVVLYGSNGTPANSMLSSTVTSTGIAGPITNSGGSSNMSTEPNSLATLEIISPEQFKTITEAHKGAIAASSVNPTKHAIALALENSKSGVIYTATYLDLQLESLYKSLSEAGSNVNVLYSSATVTASSSVANRYGTAPTSESNSGFGITLNDIFTGLLILVLLWIIINYFLNKRKEAKKTSLKKDIEDKANIPTTRFADVAGADEAVEDMQELVAFLKNPERYQALGAKSPKGALLVGPPGTGKTMLARAVAGEAGVPFYNVAGSDFVEMYVGVGAKRVRELFEKARKHPEGAIVFIDEIDAIGRSRSSSNTSNTNSEQENTLNALLVELDGFTQSKVVILGATNRDDLLDKALLRPGRLEKKVHVPLPDRAGRERILNVHSISKPLDSSVDIGLIARRTPGLSGAELAQVVNEAAMTAGRDSRETITDKDFDEAIALVTMGKGRKSAVVSDEDKLLTAWHEAGHAICGLVQDDAMNPVAISILPRSFAGGVTHFPQRDSGYMTRKQAYSQLVTAMGGMAAEQLHFGEGEFTTGPSSDLEQGSRLAFSMVTQYGMGESLFVKSEGILRASDTATDESLKEAENLLRKALEDAKTILKSHAKLVNAFVDALLERETLSDIEIKELMAGHKLKPLTSPPPAPRQYDSKNGKKPVIKDVSFNEVERKRAGIFSPLIKAFKPRRNKKRI